MIRVFSDSYFPRFYAYTVEYGSEKTRILADFNQCYGLKLTMYDFEN